MRVRAVAACLPLLAVAGAARPARAQELPARETAEVGGRGRWSVGVFNPLTVAVRDGVELQAHPIVLFLAPGLTVRLRQGSLGGWRLAGEYGAYVPTPAMKLTQGYLFPSWDQGGGKIGWWVAPTAGLLASRGPAEGSVLTLLVEVAAGLPLSHSDVGPMDAPAPLDLLFAPVTSKWRARAGVLYDHRLARRLRLRAYGDVYGRGSNPNLTGTLSHLVFRAGAGVDLAIGRGSRFTLGAAWWNSDQQAIDEATFEHHRSNEFWPTADFIWNR